MSLRDCPEAQSLPAATMRHTVPKYDMAGPVGSRPVHAEHLPRRWVYTAVPPRYHSQGAAVQYNRALAPAADSGWSRTDLLQRLKRLLMLRMTRSLVLLAAAIAGIGSLVTPIRLWAQTPTPTADQIEMFRNLSPDQQDAILKSLGSSGGGGLGAGSLLGGSSRDTGTDRQ